MNIILLILSWGTVFSIVWLQLFKIIEMWPSSIYLVLFLLVGILVWGNTQANSVSPIPPKETPKGTVKGVK